VEHARLAVDADVDAIAALATRLHDELLPTRGGALWARREQRPLPHADTYRALIGCDDVSVVVGCVHGSIVGFGVVEVETLRDGAALGVISELFVEPEARAVGVGEAMVEPLLAFCEARGCVGVDARVLPGHRAAKNFFEESGFTARALVMHRPLAGR
jgi:GNAT superfamily N-acetyltransferase